MNDLSAVYKDVQNPDDFAAMYKSVGNDNDVPPSPGGVYRYG